MDGYEQIPDNDVNLALEKANALDFVLKFDNKIDHYVGSGGGSISGGQKQRIAIARAIIRRPKMYLFDEATSALDRKNERKIQKTIDEISTN